MPPLTHKEDPVDAPVLAEHSVAYSWFSIRCSRRRFS